MNKRQTVWLITRLIGVYFAYWAIVSILSLVGAIYAYTSLPSPNNPTAKQSQQTIQVNGISIPTTAPRGNQANPNTPSVETPADKAKSDALKEVLWQFFLTVVYGGIGFYLIRNGKMLFATLIREDLTNEPEEITYSTSAESKEQVVTSTDFAPNSASKKEEVTSLNLSEYVPKSQKTAPPIAEEKSTTEKPETEPILAAEENSRMDYSLPTVEINQTEKPNEPISSVQNEPKNQAFFADETPTLIRQEMPSEEIPSVPIESSIAENEVKKRVRKVKEIVPNETIGEQPKEIAAPSDISADLPSKTENKS